MKCVSVQKGVTLGAFPPAEQLLRTAAGPFHRRSVAQLDPGLSLFAMFSTPAAARLHGSAPAGASSTFEREQARVAPRNPASTTYRAHCTSTRLNGLVAGHVGASPRRVATTLMADQGGGVIDRPTTDRSIEFDLG